MSSHGPHATQVSVVDMENRSIQLDVVDREHMERSARVCESFESAERTQVWVESVESEARRTKSLAAVGSAGIKGAGPGGASTECARAVSHETCCYCE